MTVDEMSAVEQRLLAKAAEPQPESWKHEKPGDQIIGKFRRLEKGTTTYGDCWIVILESLRSPGRLASVWLFNTTLFNEFKKVRPRPGETVLVRYEGLIQRQGAQPYHLWKVVVDRPAEADSPYSWHDIDGGEGEPTPAELQNRDEVGPTPQGDYFDAGAPSGGPNASENQFIPAATGESYADFPAVADDDIPF